MDHFGNGGRIDWVEGITDWRHNYKEESEGAAKNNRKILSAWVPAKSIVSFKDGHTVISDHGPFYQASPESVKKTMY